MEENNTEEMPPAQGADITEDETQVLDPVDEHSAEDADGQSDPDAAETQEPEQQADDGKKPRRFNEVTMLAVAVLILAIALGFAAGYLVLHNANEESAKNAQGLVDKAVEETADALDEPTWSKRYVMVHHDAVTHEVSHPAEYETVTEYHTVCNDCGAQIDGKAQEHIDSTGHSGYTRNVPVNVTKVAKEAWTETVTDVAAYDELVEDGEKSSDGQVRNNSFNDDGTPVEGLSTDGAA